MEIKEYPKIQSVFKRFREGENKGKFDFDEFSIPEFEYLFYNEWIGLEKVDGTNLRLGYGINTGGDESFILKGRTDKSPIPGDLTNKIFEYVEKWKTEGTFSSTFDNPGIGFTATLYGEGYGKKIQKPGSKYIPDGVDFILFDVRIGSWWLKRADVIGIAEQLGIKVVPTIAYGTLSEMIHFVREGFQSKVAEEELQAEGLVLHPKVPLFSRNRQRVVTKLKTKDFE